MIFRSLRCTIRSFKTNSKKSLGEERRELKQRVPNISSYWVASGSSPLLCAFVHLIHDDVRHAAELHVALQPPQQHSCGAVQKPGGGALKHTCPLERWLHLRCRQRRPYPDALQADLVAHRVPQLLGALLRHPLGHRDGGNAARLSADDVGHLPGGTVQGSIQDELRDLGGFPTPAAQ